MREVPAGCVVRVNRSGLTEERYWQLHVAEHTDSLDDTVRTVRELLASVVEQQMVVPGAWTASAPARSATPTCPSPRATTAVQH
ncbi:hypothetical protein [Streptomyces dangxiongensis]|uniref:hypothetical protein n=1 Tax=Streptomyces dangxiongensis TaxID=1442032 RepID=UPI001F08A6DE|nr:hypothetical protein [Streptomyces dangxiongensis]